MLDDVPLPARHHVEPLAPAIRLSGASSGLAGRDRARLSVPLLVLFDLAAARADGARAVDRLGLPRLRRRSATRSSSPTICSGTTRRAASRWRSELRRRGIRKRWMLVQSRVDLVARHPELLEAWRPLARDFDIFFGLEAATDEGLTGLMKDATVDHTAQGIDVARRLGYGVTGNFVIDPAWREADFERLWAFVERHQLFQAGFTILTPLPGTGVFRGDAAAAAGAAVGALRHASPALGAGARRRSASSSCTARPGGGRC